MDVYAGDQQVPSSAVIFSDNLTPFPEPRDVVYHDRTIQINSTQPQKLRPIRYNGRNLTEHSDPESSRSQTSCYASELGFLTQNGCVVNKLGAQVECEDSAQACIGSRVSPENGGGYGAVAAAVRTMKSEMDAEIMKLISQGRILEAEISSSSDDDTESSEAIRKPINQKRKRKSERELELFLENMMMKVMQKQEQMHKQLMELMEKNEKERIIREEAWKRQERDRAEKDEEIRTEETSRSLALMLYIQNFLGQEIQIPNHSCEGSCSMKVEETMNRAEFNDPNNRRWPKSEVQCLITVRTALDHKFQNGSKVSLWEEVAAGLSRMGYHRTAKKCKEKWENITKYYRRTMESGKKRPEYYKACPYFHELDLLYKNGFVNSGNAVNIKNETENKSL